MTSTLWVLAIAVSLCVILPLGLVELHHFKTGANDTQETDPAVEAWFAAGVFVALTVRGSVSRSFMHINGKYTYSSLTAPFALLPPTGMCRSR